MRSSSSPARPRLAIGPATLSARVAPSRQLTDVLLSLLRPDAFWFEDGNIILVAASTLSRPAFISRVAFPPWTAVV